MVLLSNTAVENASAPLLYPSAVTPVHVNDEHETGALSNSATRGEDAVELSQEALKTVAEAEKEEKAKSESNGAEQKSSDGDPLTEEEKAEVTELKSRDQEVRTHEQAHIAAGGQYVKGGATYSYQSGADGKQYAIGGEVNIDTSTVSGDPDATIRKMQTVRSAAMAPAEPSGQDRSVAAQANQAITQAQAQKKVDAAAEATEEENKGKEEKETAISEDRQRSNAITAYSQQSGSVGANVNFAA